MKVHSTRREQCPRGSAAEGMQVHLTWRDSVHDGFCTEGTSICEHFWERGLERSMASCGRQSWLCGLKMSFSYCLKTKQLLGISKQREHDLPLSTCVRGLCGCPIPENQLEGLKRKYRKA